MKINLFQLLSLLLQAGSAIFNARTARRERPADAPLLTTGEKVAATAGVVATVAGIVAATLTPPAPAPAPPVQP